MKPLRTRPWLVGALAAAIALTGLAIGPLSIPAVRAAVGPDTLVATLDPNAVDGDPGGSGSAELTLDPQALTACYVVDVTLTDLVGDPPTAIDVHDATTGDPGDVVLELASSVDGAGHASGCVPAGATLIDAMFARPNDFHIDVFSANYPGAALRGVFDLSYPTITLGVSTFICPIEVQAPADLTDEAKASCLSIVLPADDILPGLPPDATTEGYGGIFDFDYQVNDGVHLDATISTAERGGGGHCAGDPPVCTFGPLPYEWRPAAAVSGITIAPTVIADGYRFGAVTAASATLPGDPIDVQVGPSDVLTVDASSVPDATDIRVYLFQGSDGGGSETTPPLVGSPTVGFPVGGQLGGPAPVRLAWTGSDADSGIDHFQVQVSRDGAAYADLGGPLTTPALTTALSAGHSYRFRVQAWDVAGNPSLWAYSAIERLVVDQDKAAAIAYHGSWTTRASKTASGRTIHASTSAGSTAKLKFHGRAIAWVAPTGSTRGSAKIYIDGTYRGTVSLHGTSVPRLIGFSRTWSAVGWHTISIKVVGTRGHPRIDVDAFLVLH